MWVPFTEEVYVEHRSLLKTTDFHEHYIKNFAVFSWSQSVMACVKKFMFLLFQITFALSAGETATFSRSSFFTTRENKQLKGYVVKRLDSPSLLWCGQQCMRNDWCTSSNYKMSSEKDGKGTCELNKHNISLIDDNINFHDQQGIIFSTLLIKVM